jgi:hypothetical protein
MDGPHGPLHVKGEDVTMTSLRKTVMGAGLAAGAFMALAGTSSAQYSCGDPSSGHCYGTTTWTEQPEYFGAYTDIRVAPMATSDRAGFVDNEMWLVDENSPECRGNRFGMCWVEAGYFALPEFNGPQFFWAQVAPGGQFDLHILGPSDPVGTVDHFMIVKDGRVSPATFLVFIYTDDLRTLYAGVSVTRTGNAMSANRVDIGQELAGRGGSFAAPTNFTRNIWAVVPLGPEYVFWYAPQTTRGFVFESRPPFADWTIDPGLPPPPEGGQFTTRCCS